MSDRDAFDPTRYAADSLAAAGIRVDVEATAAEQDPRALVERVVQSIARVAPPGWEHIHAAFSLAGGAEIVNVVISTPGGRVRMSITSDIIEPIRTHRMVTIGERGPWLCLQFDCDHTGALQVAFDYGDTEIAPELLLPPEAYLRDFQEFRRPDAPVWLLAYMGNEGQQLRTAAAARAANSAAGEARAADDEVPAFGGLWARFAVLSAVCRATGAAAVGLRADPAFQVYMGDNGGCTLARLPGNRAVLSGGRNDSPLLSAAYKGAFAWPDLYRGAPAWLNNLYLDPRAGRGLLSFCYWWDGLHWYRSELAQDRPLGGIEHLWTLADEIACGVPGVWTAETTATLVKDVLTRIGEQPSEKNHYAAIDLVRAAESRIVSESHLVRLFLDEVPAAFDIAEALAQFDAADVLLPYFPPIDQFTAKDLVATFCRSNQIDTVNYDLDHLAASRLDMGWQVFAPVTDGETAIGRAVFLVADDGVIEHASTSVPPSQNESVFADRFAKRIRGSD